MPVSVLNLNQVKVSLQRGLPRYTFQHRATTTTNMFFPFFHSPQSTPLSTAGLRTVNRFGCKAWPPRRSQRRGQEPRGGQEMQEKKGGVKDVVVEVMGRMVIINVN